MSMIIRKMNRSNISARFGVIVTLFMMQSGVKVWADTDYTITLSTEYTSVPCIFAGSANYFKLEIGNSGATDAQNVVANLLVNDLLVWEETIGSIPANDKVTLDADDPTIRPVDGNTIWGNGNDTVAYKVVVKEGGVVKKQQEYRYGVVYNGNLGKDYAFPSLDTTLRVYSFKGDVQVQTLPESSYMNSQDTIKDDVFAIDLGGGSVHKALLYVSYNWDRVAEGDFKSWTAAFNDNTVVPIADYRDCTNMGHYGRYGYGLVVYDVTDFVTDGDNTFTLHKPKGNVAVYPSSMIVMIGKPSSKPKAVYIVEEADLLSAQYHKNKDAVYPSSFEGISGTAASLYVFAATAQSGEGDLIIGGNLKSDVWSGTSKSVEVYKETLDPGDISIDFKSTGSTILALQQMVVVELEDQTTGIIIPGDKNEDAPWYGLDGRKLDGKPTQRGVYIHGTRKVVIY